MSAIQFEKNEIVISELREFSEKVEAFNNSKMDPEEFKHRRLLQGIYGQRQPNVFMVRVKIPAGHLNEKMIEGITEASDLFADGSAHITTRQDVQLYYVKIENLIPLLDKLADYGITTREASGATIRNVITSAFAGSLRTQSFDILPTVETLVRYFLRHPETQHLPRKFKISFSESEEDLGVTGINDMGIMAVVQNNRPGFKLSLGGSLGSAPVIGRVYKEFVPAEDLILEVLAVLRAFNRYGNREKRAEARLKFQFEKMGFDKFVELAAKEKEAILEEKIELPEVRAELEQPAEFDFSNPYDKSIQPERYLWFQENVKPTVRKNEYMVVVQVPNGDLKTDTFRALSKAHALWRSPDAREFLTLMDSQNLVLKGLKTEEQNKKDFFNNVYTTLKSLGLERPGYHHFSDVLTCMGSATCASGITHSPGLAAILSQSMYNTWTEEPRFRDATIHISGCSNACARHQVATLGFSGRADKTFASGQEAPAYNLYFGGAMLTNGEVRLGRKINEKLLAKRIPAFIEALIKYFREKSEPEETFVEFMARADEKKIAELVQSFGTNEKPAEPDEMLHYDWGKDRPYVMEYGEGECS